MTGLLDGLTMRVEHCSDLRGNEGFCRSISRVSNNRSTIDVTSPIT